MTLAPAVTGWDAPPALPQASPERVDVWRLPPGADTRVALRRLLARYLGRPAAAVTLRAGARGKPVLAPLHGVDLRFNLAHSDSLALVAVRLGHDVGVDLERVRPDVDCEAVVATVFPPELRVAWRSGPAVHRRAAFFDAWVRFEALAKASGRGIADAAPLEGSERYACRALPEIAGFAAAVASSGHGWTLACWRAPVATGGIARA